jgi:hypothetical protein
MTGTTEELLSAILQAITPCPDICDNQSPYTAGTSDIHSGWLISGYENMQGYNYLISGATPCLIQYIDKGGNLTELSPTTGSTGSICAKKIISNTCSTLIKGSACF